MLIQKGHGQLKSYKSPDDCAALIAYVDKGHDGKKKR